MKRVKKEACAECPFKRTAVQGYLGAADTPMDFIGPHWHGDEPLPCHMTIDWERGDCQAVAQEKPLCRGLLIMMRNSAKAPRDRNLSEARNSVEGDRKHFFSHLGEFLEFHDMGQGE